MTIRVAGPGIFRPFRFNFAAWVGGGGVVTKSRERSDWYIRGVLRYNRYQVYIFLSLVARLVEPPPLRGAIWAARDLKGLIPPPTPGSCLPWKLTYRAWGSGTLAALPTFTEICFISLPRSLALFCDGRRQQMQWLCP